MIYVQYMRQSNHNHEAGKYLEGADMSIRRVITTSFYAAIHAVNEYLSKQKCEIPSIHDKRRRMAGKKLPKVFDEYLTLQKIGNRSRYEVVFVLHPMIRIMRGVVTTEFMITLQTDWP